MTERLRIETRQVGGRLVGEVQYNTPASDRPEMFDVGAFDSVSDPLNLTLQHDREREPVASTADGTLEVRDTSTSLQLAARLRPGSAEHQLVTRGSLAGLSVEFAAREERQSDGNADHFQRSPPWDRAGRSGFLSLHRRVAGAVGNGSIVVPGADTHREGQTDAVRMRRRGL